MTTQTAKDRSYAPLPDLEQALAFGKNQPATTENYAALTRMVEHVVDNIVQATTRSTK